MEILMYVLTILNSLVLIVILWKQNLYSVSFTAYRTTRKDTLLGWELTVWKMFRNGTWASGSIILRIPIRNRKKTELREEVERMKKYSAQNKLQNLTAMFSWLKTWKDVKEFEKNYSVVDPEIVSSLVKNFKEK